MNLKTSFNHGGTGNSFFQDERQVNRSPFDRLRANGVGDPFVVSLSNHEHRISNSGLTLLANQENLFTAKTQRSRSFAKKTSEMFFLCGLGVFAPWR
jgi:hypothetical protein